MKVLVVDDSRIIRQMAMDVIREKITDVDILLADSGEEALSIISEQDVDLMILDIIMPGLSGMDVLVEMKELNYFDNLKVIMFTSLSDKSSMHECFQLGATDYIGKPIDPDEFSARVQNGLNQQKLKKDLSESIEQMKKQNLELLELNSRIQETQLQLVQKEQMASVGQLAAGVAHEINNPLGFIISNFDVMKDYFRIYDTYIRAMEDVYVATKEYIPESSQIASKVNELKLETDLSFIREDLTELYLDTDDGLSRVRKIVESLRLFSKVDQFEEYEEYNLNNGIEKMVVLTKNEVKYIADLEVDLDEKIPQIYAIGYQINQTLLNMLMNALDSIKLVKNERRGFIKITTYQDDGYIVCTMRDNGLGIPDEILSNVFNPFFTSKPIGDSVGLGLSISYDIVVNKHSGTLEVNSQYGEYAEFIMRLPIESAKRSI